MERMNASAAATTPWWHSLKADLPASVVVFLVALPLCMGVAVASGVPPALGLVTGIVGGLVVGALAGSPLQVSGPAAGLTVLVWDLIQTHGLKMLGPIVLGAGLLQLVAGAAKLGPWFRAVSPAVVNGMLAGIGVLIVAGQVHVMLDDKPRGGGLANLMAWPEAFWKVVSPMEGATHHWAAALGLLTIAVMVAWNYAPKALRVLPAPLVAAGLATLINELFDFPVKTIEVPEALWTALNVPGLGEWMRLSEGPVLVSVVTVAVIASAETLLSATAVDQLHSGERTKYNKELAAQGVGNAICGLLGALPMTGVIVRSSANVGAGAQTRASAMFHGLWLLLAVVALPFALRWIPTTALAAMLVYTGFKLVNVQGIRRLAEFGRTEVFIYFATVLGIVATNLLEGVLIGVGLTLAKLVFNASRLEVELLAEAKAPGQDHRLALHGAATFLRLPTLANALEAVPRGAALHVDVSGLSNIDHACLELLANFEKQHVAMGGTMMLDWNRVHGRYQAGRPSRTGRLAAGGASEAEPSELLSSRR
jgi:MFS superfamily sulfate permease-like transporter